MKNVNQTTFKIVLGIIILFVFSYVSYLNIKTDVLQSDSYFAKNEEEMIAKIESYEINDSTLKLVTSGDIKSYCIKSTRSEPNEDSICWKDTDTNINFINVLKGNRYYLWIKDENNNISNFRIIKE